MAMNRKQRLIDANSIVAVAEHAYDQWNLAMAAADSKHEINLVYKRQELCKAVKAVAENAPTVDAVPVVRCENCRYWERWETIAGVSNKGYCLCHNVDGIEADDFCSYGEREVKCE